MWWRFAGHAKEFHPACDHACRSAEHSGPWHVNGAELENKQHNLGQHQRSRHLPGHWFGTSHAYSDHDLYGDRDGTGRNNPVLNCGKRNRFRSTADGCFERPAQHHRAGRIGSSELDDNQYDFGQHRGSGNIRGDWIDYSHSNFYYHLHRHGGGPRRNSCVQHHGNRVFESAAHDFNQCAA
jgi:hypothetical protein